MRKLIVAVPSLLLVLIFAGVVLADPPERLSAPVTYKDTMLIAVTKDGVAAIVFGDPVDMGRKYRYRFLPSDGEKEITGEGSVWETYVDGKYDGGNLNIKAGSISFEWSQGGDERGWVYYQPEETRLQIANADRFEAHEGFDSKKVEKLDLKRFLKQP